MSSGRPYATYMIIALTVIIHAYSTLIAPSAQAVIRDEYALNPSYVMAGRRLVSLLSYALVHAGWPELFVNSLALLLVGTVLEGEVGWLRFAGIFAVAGAASGVVYVALNQGSTLPLTGYSPSVLGLVAVLFLLVQFDKVDIYRFQIPGAFIGLLALSIEATTLYWSRGSVFPGAHVTGFAAGVASAFIMDREKAVKGALMAAVIGAVLYLLGLYLGATKSP